MSAHATETPLNVYQEYPLNAGAPLERLPRSFLTPTELFFVRTHGSLPSLERDTYRLNIAGLVRHPLELSLLDLLKQFEQHTLTATLVCAGSRRRELAAIRPLPGELLWGPDPISTARWRGARLSEVLAAAGVQEEARYVEFRGLDQAQIEGTRTCFASSISLEKALEPEVLLVYEMNDEPLTPAHGFPLRVLVPGYVGTRSVKWLQEITLLKQPSTNYFQARDYKLFPPGMTAENVDWSQGQPVEEIALNSVICTPGEGETRPAGPTSVQGYAINGGNATIERVEVSGDKGVSWTPATITSRAERWAWCLWKTTLNLPPGPCQLTVRAWDAAGQTQPADPRPLWNFKGYANHAWHQVHVYLT
jgi:sulfite oxidase